MSNEVGDSRNSETKNSKRERCPSAVDNNQSDTYKENICRNPSATICCNRTRDMYAYITDRFHEVKSEYEYKLNIIGYYRRTQK